MEARPWIEDFSAGYMQRVMHLFPKQGNDPWRNTQDFEADKKMVRDAPVDDGALIFGTQNTRKLPDNVTELRPRDAA